MSGRVVHFEVPFDDGDRARQFYAEVFDWQFQDMPGMDYTMVSTGPMGDMGPTEPGYIGGGMTQRVGVNSTPVITIAVDDIDETLAAIEGLGGTTLMGRQPVADMGFTAYATDSEGNTIGLWENAAMG